MYRYLFGPVPSRRLGISLGIDLVPKKVCTLDCVYCEVGKTTKLTLERAEYILFERLKEELEDFFSQGNPDPDFITFSGSGEPTLHSRIGEVVDLVKFLRPDIPVAVLTNGTLFGDPEVRKALFKADRVLPSLDAAREESFIRINEPAEGLILGDYIQGLIDFQREYTGQILLEVLILPGYNDGREDILALKEAIGRIGPQGVQLNTLDRPGRLADLKPASREVLESVAARLDYPNCEIIASAVSRKDQQAYRRDAESAILETIARRPCTLEDLVDLLGLHRNEVNKYLGVLEGKGKIRPVPQERGVFYQLEE